MKFNENSFFLLRSDEIQQATNKSYRQYFCGNLQRPQLLNYLQTESLEVGVSDYFEFTADEPHFHKFTPDMIYILQGEYHIMLLNENPSPIILKNGDFVSVPAGVAYASKAKAGTKTLFIKQIKENDKVSVTPSPEVLQWIKEEI